MCSRDVAMLPMGHGQRCWGMGGSDWAWGRSGEWVEWGCETKSVMHLWAVEDAAPAIGEGGQPSSVPDPNPRSVGGGYGGEGGGGRLFWGGCRIPCPIPPPPQWQGAASPTARTCMTLLV